MHYRDDTLEELKKLYRDFGLSNEKQQIQNFSEDLDYVLSKLSRMLVSELDVDRSGPNDEKVLKFFELAVLASQVIENQGK